MGLGVILCSLLYLFLLLYLLSVPLFLQLFFLSISTYHITMLAYARKYINFSLDCQWLTKAL